MIIGIAERQHTLLGYQEPHLKNSQVPETELPLSGTEGAQLGIRHTSLLYFWGTRLRDLSATDLW